MTTQKEKPPAQVAGVQGFNAFTTPADEKKVAKIDWVKIVSLPPFEMFAKERYGVSEHLLDWVKSKLDTNQTIYYEYAEWHKNKGYWEHETPAGEII